MPRDPRAGRTIRVEGAGGESSGGRGLTLEDVRGGGAWGETSGDVGSSWKTVRGGGAWGETSGHVGSPWGAQRRPTSPFLTPTCSVLLLRVLTWGMAWTEPSAAPHCQAGRDTCTRTSVGARELGAPSARRPLP